MHIKMDNGNLVSANIASEYGTTIETIRVYGGSNGNAWVSDDAARLFATASATLF